MAQRRVLDEMKQREILAIAAVGCSRRTAARYVGCAVSTIRNTAQREPDFAARLRQAEQGAEYRYMRRIKKAAEKEQYWRAAAWALERKYPERYAARRPDTVTVADMVRILRQFAAIIVAEVPVGRYRQNIVKQLDQMTAQLRSEPWQREKAETP